VRAGLASWCRQYARHGQELERLEAEARAARRGLWVDPESGAAVGVAREQDGRQRTVKPAPQLRIDGATPPVSHVRRPALPVRRRVLEVLEMRAARVAPTAAPAPSSPLVAGARASGRAGRRAGKLR